MLSMISQTDAGRAQTACQRAAEFIRSRVREQRYSLACFDDDGKPCPVHRQGHVFSSFFMADAAPDLFSREEKRVLLARICAEDRGGVWAYGPSAPPDADDTAFTLRTLQLLGQPISMEGLMRFLPPRAELFATFRGNSQPRLVFLPSPADNMEAHPEVAANVYCLLQRNGMGHLIRPDLIACAQTAEGWWHSYFYPSRYYATYFFLELLSRIGTATELRARGLRYVRETQNHDGTWGSPANSYDTAMALNALLTSGDTAPCAVRGVDALLLRQAGDGSWRSENVIWQFRFDPSVTWRAYDDERVVATALAMRALKKITGA